MAKKKKDEIENNVPAEPTALELELAKLPSTDKAAVIMLLLGEEHAAEVLRHLEPKEVQALGQKMTSVANLSKEVISGVLAEFIDSTSGKTNLGIGSLGYTQSVFNKALGQEKAASVLGKIMPGESLKGLEMLQWMDAKSIHEFIQNEHPQVIAVVLSVLEHDTAGELLKFLSEDIRADVIARVSSLDAVKPSAMSHLEEVLREQFLNKSGTSSATFGGVKTAAQILKYSGSEVESSILKSVNELDKTLAEKLEENMFTFMNLGGLDNKSMQTLIRDLENDLLIPALKGADEAVKEKFLENMSERARDLFLDDLEAQGPIRITEVEKSQKEIMRVARKLSEEGEIMLSTGGNEFV